MNEAREIHNFLLWNLPYLLWDLACFMGRSFSCSEKCSSMKQRTIRYAGGLILQKGKVIYGKERIFTHTQKNGCVNTISSSRISKEGGTDERI